MEEVIKTLMDVYESDQNALKNVREVAKQYGINSEEVKVVIKETDEITKDNVAIIDSIIEKYGWLGEDQIGRIPNQTLWLIIQHADIETQQRYYPIIRAEAKKGNVSLDKLAKFEDRMLVNQNKNQIYGTQFRTRDDLTFEPWPIDDIEHLDERRSMMCLEPFDVELERMGIKKNNQNNKKTSI